MTIRQIAYRLKSEGKAEVIRDANEVALAYRASYAQAEAGANAASSAAERQEQRYRRLAVAAREAERAEATQARYNAAKISCIFGHVRPPGNLNFRRSVNLFAIVLIIPVSPNQPQSTLDAP